jgi:hypothetical protein
MKSHSSGQLGGSTIGFGRSLSIAVSRHLQRFTFHSTVRLGISKEDFYQPAGNFYLLGLL